MMTRKRPPSETTSKEITESGSCRGLLKSKQGRKKCLRIQPGSGLPRRRVS